jgi:ssDNA-binding Zn-finger/Zn-ribbon topoisomerase 1
MADNTPTEAQLTALKLIRAQEGRMWDPDDDKEYIRCSEGVWAHPSEVRSATLVSCEKHGWVEVISATAEVRLSDSGAKIVIDAEAEEDLRYVPVQLVCPRCGKLGRHLRPRVVARIIRGEVRESCPNCGNKQKYVKWQKVGEA